MPSNDSTVRFKADISQLKSQMQAAERQIKLVNSEFKAATAGMDDWSKSADGLSAKTKQLSGVLEGQNKKLELMEKELEATVKAYGENSAAADRVRIKINEQKAAIAKTESQLKTYEGKLDDLSKGMDKAADGTEEFKSATDKLKSSISEQQSKLDGLKKHYADLVAEGKGLSDEAQNTAREISELSSELQENKTRLSEAEKAADEFDNSLDDVDDAAQKASDGFSIMRGALADLVADGIKATISAVKDLAKETFQVGSNFESAMSQVAAVSGAGADEVEQLTAKAEEMGAKTKFSATESAEAFNYMAMAGWKTEDMLNGIEGIMNLAAASGADLATSSDIVTDALTAMGYGAQDAGKLADVLAAASSNANTNVEMMGGTFKYAAPLVGALGYNMEDTALAAGLMANAGIKAEKAGTALRSIFSRLSAPPKECAESMDRLGLSLTDGDGKMKDFSVIMEELREKFANLSETEQTAEAKHIAGQEAMSGLLAIVNAAPADYDKLKDAIYNSAGAAQEMADTMQDNVGGQLVLLKSKIEGIMIKLFKRASDSMRSGIDTVGDALDKVNWDKVGDAIGNIANKAASLFSYVINNSGKITSIVKTIASVIGTIFISNKIVSITTAISGFVSVLTSAKTATEGLATVTKLLGINMNALPIMAVIGALAALYAYTKKQEESYRDNAAALYGLSDEQQRLIDDINASTEAEQRANEARKEAGNNIDYEYAKIQDLKRQYNDIIDENGKVKEGYEDFATYLKEELADALGVTVQNIEGNIDANGRLGKSIDDLIEKKKLEAKLAAFEPHYKDALQNELEYWQALKQAKKEQASAQDVLVEKQAAYNKALDDLNKNTNVWASYDLTMKFTEARENLEAAQKTFADTSKAVKDASNNWSTAQTNIEYYQDAMAASTEGNANKVNDALLSMQYGLKNHTTATEAELKAQWVEHKKNLEDIEEIYKESDPTNPIYEDMKRVNQLTETELNKWVEKNKKAGNDSVNELNKGYSAGIPKVSVTAGELGYGSRLALFNSMGDWGALADERTDDYIDAIDGKKSDANQKGGELAKATADGAKNKTGEYKNAAEEGAAQYIDTINSKEADFNAAGEQAAGTTAKGAQDQAGQFGTAAEVSADEYKKTIESFNDDFNNTGVHTGEITAKGAQDQVPLFKKAGESSANEFTVTIDSKSGKFKVTGKQMTDSTAEGANAQASAMRAPGENGASAFISGIQSKNGDAQSAGSGLASSANSGLGEHNEDARNSGHYFGQGFINGIGDLFEAVWQKAKELAQKAWDGLKAGQQEGSPSKLTLRSGRYFGEGYRNGIKELTGDVVKTAAQMGRDAVKALREAQQEGSPSKLTYKSGRNFTQGYINGIASLEKSLQKTATKMATGAVKKLMLASNPKKVEKSASKASDSFAKSLQAKAEYARSWMQYKNNKMLADFDKTINELQKKSEKELAAKQKASEKKQKEYQNQINEINKVDEQYRTEELWTRLSNAKSALSKEQKELKKATKKIESTYNKQIKTQQKMKASYQQASASLISEFSAAMDNYQQAAQDLIDKTLDNLSSKYDAKYDALINKQDDLIQKLRSAGNLFELEDANVMTAQDLKAQTKQIKDYAAKLKKIKGKVSEELFDQITSYDMKEGSAFVTRLLSMSKKELNAYNEAYSQKLNAADKLAKSIYKDDFKKLDTDYKKDVKEAFKDLDKDLEKIGRQSLKGFVNGLTGNTSYMDSQIKTFIKGMIATFKSELGIKSPSKVTKKIGYYTVQGFAKGISDNSSMVEKAVEDATTKATSGFDFTRLSAIDGFEDAMSDFESRAKEILTTKLDNIGAKYAEKADAIFAKRDSLAKKLQSGGSLFNLNNVNMMTTADMKAEIKQMKEYSSQLSKIKGKVSSALFDQILTYNQKDGMEYIKRLLSMSKKELEEYSKTYDKKLSLSNKLSKNVYNDDLNKVAKEYDKEIKEAFKKLPDQLTKIGKQSIKGFLAGLGSDSKSIKTSVTDIVNNVVKTFKKQLGIKSPSKVTKQIGTYTVEGFASGITKNANMVTKAVTNMTKNIVKTFNFTRLSSIEGFSAAMSEFENRAKETLTTTLNNIGETYKAKAEEIVNQQNSLAEKLKSGGNLFTLSNANIMTTADLNNELKDMQTYANKLKKVKGKVSSALFERILTYDQKDGLAFINRLLSMTEKELKAYTSAYDKNLSLANQLSANVYRDDLDKVAKSYDDAVGTAFKKLPNKLKTIGKQTMAGFLEGLGGNAKIVKKDVNSIVDNVVTTFKKDLGIKSPSKVTKKIGAYTAEGFADGISKNADMVTNAVTNMTKNIVKSFDFTRLSSIEGFSAAMSEYENKAKETLTTTLNNIGETYKTKADDIISQQNSLSEKLKNGSGIFTLSNANLMTTADLNNELKDMQAYADKLKKIKGKVSSALYEQILNYDQKDGLAFINRLLSMTEKELKAYTSAYDKNLSLANQLSANVYRDDLDKVAKSYDAAVESAFKKLPTQLKEIGKQTMAGFLEGLGGSAKYVKDSVNDVVNNVVTTFKKDLGIKSPSKVTKKIGAYTAEGFAEGISKNTEMVTKAIETMTKKVSTSFDWTRLSFVDDFATAMSSFENDAKSQITNSLESIGDKYKEKFDELINKQKNLSDKFRENGDLFTLSSANVMKVVDINAEIKEMQTYANELNKIKGKVSSKLFDEITTYNVKEGKAFIERLLGMSAKELKAYSDAYDKKLSLADQLSQNLYRNDLNKVANDYDKEIEKAFAGLPAQLQKIGNQTLQGFLNGLGGEAKYVNESVKNIVKGVVDTFKSTLGIHSPSKVMEELGEYTAEGFADGIKSMIDTVKEAAQEITDTVTSALNWQEDINSARGTLKAAAGSTGLNRNAGAYEGTNTQIINFNQTNNSPKALDRLTLYRQTNNMLFSAKVRLADV